MIVTDTHAAELPFSAKAPLGSKRRPVDEPNPTPSPDYIDSRANEGSLLTQGTPSSLHRATHAVSKSGIGAELLYWAKYLARGVVQPKHMRAALVTIKLLTANSPDTNISVAPGERVENGPVFFRF
jgi:hypothetical protein